MSHTTVITIHCDNCGTWEDCSSGVLNDSAAYAKDRKRRGWTKANGEDFCPDCSRALAEGGTK